MFWEKFQETWKNLHFILFLPDLISLGFNILLLVLFYQYSGLNTLFSDPQVSSGFLKDKIPIVEKFISENALRLTLSFTFFVLTSFVVGTGFVAMKFGMMRDVVLGRKPSFLRMYHYSFIYLYEVIMLRILMFFILGAAFIVSLFVFPIVDRFVDRFFSVIATVVFIVVSHYILKLTFFFRYPALFIEKNSATKALKASADFVKDKFLFVIGVWVLVTGVYWLISAVQLNLIINSSQGLFITSLGILILVWNLWSDLFLFFIFKSES